MKSKESIESFYERHKQNSTNAGKFNVYRIEGYNSAASSPYTRRDFYKIMLIDTAQAKLIFADKEIEIKDHTLMFGNPMVPYSWEGQKDNVTGYFCVFTEEFINYHLKTESVAKSALFKVGGHPVLYLENPIYRLLKGIFEQMLTEIASPYLNKYDLLRSYVQIIIHESLKITPDDQHYKSGSSLARVCSLFLMLLERQFPVTSPDQVLQFKNANEFAAQLGIHTNHLNKALREVTGKTTTEHISEKLVTEAKALLRFSDWAVAEIGYALGFGYPSNFDIFFKKKTGETPNQFRRQCASIS